MDRNALAHLFQLSEVVALRKESVDRNTQLPTLVAVSLIVALRKESVDRNPVALLLGKAAGVALRKESVDRNTVHTSSLLLLLRRSPQGERG